MKSSPSALHKSSSFAIWIVLAVTFCAIALPAGAVRSTSETSWPGANGDPLGGSFHPDTVVPWKLEWAKSVPRLLGVRSLPSTSGATINVNSTLQSPGNSGDCTLGEAIIAANQDAPIDGCPAGSGVDTILLPAGTYSLTTVDNTHERVGPLGLPIIYSNVLIQGAGATATIIERDQNAPSFGLLGLPDSFFSTGAGTGSLVLNDVTLRAGRGLANGQKGGAIFAGDRTVSLNNVTFDNNVAHQGGAIGSFGIATVNATNCSFTNNRATNGSGGAIEAAHITVGQTTFDGNSAFSGGGAIYFIQGGQGLIDISDSTFTNNSIDNDAGAVLKVSGNITVTHSNFSHNSANGNAEVGAIIAGGTVEIVDSAFTNNQANSTGGIYLGQSGLGAAETFKISGCNISNNSARVFTGGLRVDGSGPGGTYTGTIANSTISGNTATFDAGGIFMRNQVDLTILNTTIDGNTAHRDGGGIYSTTFTALTHRTTLKNVTLSGNHADNAGGGFYRASGELEFGNSIIALNTSGANSGPDVITASSDPTTSHGYNLIGIKDGAAFINATGDLTGTAANPIDPLLGPLQANGGSTFTRALLSSSPAMDAANPANPGSGGDACEALDQRGITRPQDGDANGLYICDIGAVENGAPPAGLFQFGAATYEVAEGSGLVSLSVQRVDGSAGAVSVTFSTADGNALADDDYTAKNISLDFANGELSKTVTVVIAEDLIDEGDETFNFKLSSPTNGAGLGSPNTGVVTITDNDNPPTISVNDISVTEGNSGVTFVNFTLSLSAPSGRLVSVDFATADGTATAGSDYFADGATINFLPGVTTGNFPARINGDTDIEPDETLFLNLVNPTNATIADAQGECTILNDDAPSSPTPTPTITPTPTPTVTPTPSPTPAPSPLARPSTNGSLIFTSDRDGNAELYMIDVNGGAQRRLTNDPASDLEPSWSYDGTRIAFTSDRSGNFDIYTVNHDGSGLAQLTNHQAEDSGPAWSPDGTKIAFTSGRDGNFNVYVIGLDSTGARALTTNSADDYSPSWSPDGTRIAFISNRDGNTEIYVMNADGSGESRLTTNAANDFDPAWSVDGSTLVFMRFESFVRNYEIFVVNANGTGETRLTVNSFDDLNPSWTPDNSAIMFASRRNGNAEIYRMNPDGSAQQNMSHHPANDEEPDMQAACRITGAVLDLESDHGIAGVTLILSGSQTSATLTDEAGPGDFVFTLTKGGSYTITPSLDGLAFSPGSKSFDNVQGNLSAGNFYATSVPSADLSLTQTVSPDPVAVEGELTWVVTVANNGPAPATDVRLVETRPQNAPLVTAPQSSQGSPCHVIGTQGDLLCELGTINPGANATLTLVMRPHNSGPITNSARVSATERDPNQANNATTRTASVTESPDISVSQSGSPDPVNAGNHLTYSIKVSNAGPGTATNVSLRDAIPRNVRFISATPNRGSCELISGVLVICNLGSLASSEVATVEVVVEPTSGGTRTNSVNVTSNEEDPHIANNESVVNSTVAALNITGTILKNNRAKFAGVLVALSGGRQETTITDGGGQYAFSNLEPHRDYAVSALMNNYTMAPNFGFEDLRSSQLADFTATPVNLTISGRLTASGYPVRDAEMLLTGSQTAAATTDEGGNYSFTVAADDDYTVTPVRPFTTFNPAAQTFNRLSSNQTLNFQATTDFIHLRNLGSGVSGDWVRTADFNRDGKLDLLTGFRLSFGIGDGTFAPATIVNDDALDNGFFPNDAVVNDINRDGKPDIIYVMDGLLKVLLGTGTGTFNGTPFINVGTLHQDKPLAIADFNRDGNPDVVVVDIVDDHFNPPAFGRVEVRLGDGSGQLGTPTRHRIRSSHSNRVVAADFNSDGHPDLLVQGLTGPETVTTLLTNDGRGGFRTSEISFGLTGSSFAVGDFNGDSKLDVATSIGTSINLVFGNGAGGFGPKSSFPIAREPFCLDFGNSIATGDLNGDGNLDFVAGTGCGIAILYGTHGVPSATPLQYHGGGGNVAIGDFNADGKPEVASSEPGHSHSVALFLNLLVRHPVGTTLRDDFNDSSRNVAIWNQGTLTFGSQPSAGPEVVAANQSLVGAVSVQQLNGQLHITPAEDTNGANYDGYVSAQTFDLTTMNVSTELVQSTSASADTIFAVGVDSSNWLAFVVSDATGGMAAGSTDAGGEGLFLYCETNIAGVRSFARVPYDAVEQRYLRLRYDGASNAVVFETSPDRASWQVTRSVPKPFDLTALRFELSAGTDHAVAQTGVAIFDDFRLLTGVVEISTPGFSILESGGRANMTVTRTGDLTVPAIVNYATSDGTANERSDYTTAAGSLSFAPGEEMKSLQVFITDDALSENTETMLLTLSSSSGAIVGTPASAEISILDNDALPSSNNPTDAAQFFVRQHYLDFLGREPDAAGLAFWTNEITSCGSDASCIAVKRQNVSAAFFLSIEYQQTGFFATRIQRVAFGHRSVAAANRINYQQLTRYTRMLGEGVVVGQAGFEPKLDANKRRYLEQIVNSNEFIARFPATQTAMEFVMALYSSAGVAPATGELRDAVAAFDAGGTTGRAAALRKVADSDSVTNDEFNAAFVLMQYHGYLRRNPTDAPDTDDSGYQFWLAKLNQFSGNFINAEMVKAFIICDEYRTRFGQN